MNRNPQREVEFDKIDKNFKIDIHDGQELVWYDVKEAPFQIYGLMRTDDGARFCRMKSSVAMHPNINNGVKSLYTNTAGGRVRFSTDSPYIALKCTFDKRTRFGHMPDTGVRGFDLFLDGEHDSTFFRVYMPSADSKDGYTRSGKYTYLEGMHSYTLNFPLYNNVDELYIGLAPGAKVGPGKEYQYKKPAVFYGSSITQGGCASRPGNSFAALISNWLDMDYVNLGFSGSGIAEVEMMEYIASLDMGMFVYDYDHNAPNAEHLIKTHERGFRIFREKQPDTPVIFVSRPDWQTTANHSEPERRDVIYRTYSNAINAGDKNVAFVDGRSFFAGRNRFDSTVDGTHPNDLGMFRMAEGIADAMQLFLRDFR